MNNTFLATALLLTTCTLTTVNFNVAAHEKHAEDNCDVELNYDLSISPEHIRIIENDHTLVDIFQDKMLFVRGEQMALNQEQQTMLTEYAQSIRQSIPEAGELAVQAVSLAYQGIEAAIGEHVDLSASREKFERLEQKITDKFNDSGHYSFQQGEFSFDGEDSEIDRMAEEIVEDMMPQLIGGLLSNIGQAVANGDGDFSAIENLAEKVEREVELKAEAIKGSAEAFCYRLSNIDALENELVNSSDDLKYLDVLNVKSQPKTAR